MRTFFVILVSALVLLSAVAPAQQAFSQADIYEAPYYGAPQRPGVPTPAAPEQNSDSRHENGGNWIFFHMVWMVTLAGLYFLLKHHREEKLKVRVANGKRDLPVLNKGQKRLILFLALVIGGILGVSMIILILNHFWWFALILTFALIAIVGSQWELISETRRSLKQKEDVAAHLITEEKTAFKDVGGLKEVIEELQDVVSLYKDRKEAELWDIRLPTGILLVGPPGCGKTLLARAVAGEAKLNFLAYSGAEVGNSYVRSGAQGVKNIFEEAAEKSPCLIFFDEIDALGRKRGYDASGEFDHALTELLHEMDGIKRKSGVLVLAATNREDVLDEALLRPGRFDKKILLPPPDVGAREEILKIHTAKKRLAEDANLGEIAKKTPGFNGATLEQVTNEAAQLARRRFEEERKRRGALGAAVDAAKEFFLDPERLIVKADFEEAILRVQLGPARNLIMSNSERKIVAQHEIGHAVVTAEKGLEVLEKVTLMPRNWALGLMVSRSEESYLPSKMMILGRISSLLGGRAAEEIFLGADKVTTGGGNDFEKAEELARRMVCEWGMGELGPTIYYRPDGGTFNRRLVSEETLAKIDEEVRKIISGCLKEAKEIIANKKETAARLVDLLLEKTVLDAKDITDVLTLRPAQGYGEPVEPLTEK